MNLSVMPVSGRRGCSTVGQAAQELDPNYSTLVNYLESLRTQFNNVMSPRAPSFELRDAQDNDYGLAERLYLETMKPLLARLGALDEPQLIVNFKRLYEPGDVKIIIVDGVDAGWLQISENEREISLYQIHIKSGYRCRGIGTRLMEDLLARGQQRGKPVTLYVVRNNPALTLYKRLGFKVVGEDETKLYMQWE
jgi:ribosomal protein S18 acetylase RimI-like enzyme